MKNEEKSMALHSLRDVINRLNKVAVLASQNGYDIDCIETIKQIQMAQTALDRVRQMIISGQFHTCLILAANGNESSEREKMLLEISELFSVCS